MPPPSRCRFDWILESQVAFRSGGRNCEVKNIKQTIIRANWSLSRLHMVIKNKIIGLISDEINRRAKLIRKCKIVLK